MLLLALAQPTTYKMHEAHLAAAEIQRRRYSVEK